jgi:hypothetical protein
MKRVITINEISIWKAIWYGLHGMQMHVVLVKPLIYSLDAPLNWICNWLQQHDLLKSGFSNPLNIPTYDGYPGDSFYRPYSPDIENGMRHHVAKFETHPVLGPYAYAFRKALSHYCQEMLNLTGAIAWISDRLPREEWRAMGVNDLFIEVARLSGFLIDEFNIRRISYPAKLASTLNSIILSLAMIAWIVVRIRPVVRVRSFKIALDRSSPIEPDIAALARDPNDVLIVERNRSNKGEKVPRLNKYTRVTIDDGRVTFRQAIKLIFSMLKEAAWLWKDFSNIDPWLYLYLLLNIVKRPIYAAFFNRFPCMVFWGRDDYSMTHIVRNQEVRKIGGTTIGVAHGLPYNTFISQWREIDFDLYYVLGIDLYNSYYKYCWPIYMKVEAIGNVLITPEIRASVLLKRTKDIAFFATVMPTLPELMNQVIKIARLFPERLVWVREKPGRDATALQQFRQLCNNLPSNVVVHIKRDPFDLLLEVGYVITGTSTVIAEAVGLGAIGFVLDIDPKIRHLYFRRFPWLIATSGEEIVNRILAIESKREEYPFILSDKLFSSNDTYQIIASDIARLCYDR